MNAPDKIYLNKYMIRPGMLYPAQYPADTPEFEYIRKDALLEWLKMAVECYSHPDTVNVVDTIRCEGKKWAFQDVINKIESL